MVEISGEIAREVDRRRTFAIISHPDAGKTSLTEKLLLFGGCIEVAGAVRGRKTQRAATSDWMELEKQRGISVSSTVLSFEFEAHQINLLDTPGHHDFSEDTYRTLMAADCAVMVLDNAKGIETQTEKLFRVCALRRIPVITFINKVDRPGRAPLALLAEIESRFDITAVPMNWPIGMGQDFVGVVDLPNKQANIFDQTNSDRRVPFRSFPLEDLAKESKVSQAICQEVLEEVELLETTDVVMDREQFLDGSLTPVFFGSALTNLGVEHFLRAFLHLCPSPTNRNSNVGPIEANREEFAGFVFKIQANLDPKHRDRVAFVRVCAGRFRREMDVLHSRSGKKLRLRRALKVFGQDRETMEEAFPGDIIGLVNPGEFHLGDTICEGDAIHFDPLPQFPPENFAMLRCKDTRRRKQFRKGIDQLIEEGAIQLFSDTRASNSDPLLAAVGELQFDVVRFRLQTEYDTETDIEWLPYKMARWIGDRVDPKPKISLPFSSRLVHDQWGYPVALFKSQWDADYAARQNPEFKFLTIRSTMGLTANLLDAQDK